MTSSLTTSLLHRSRLLLVAILTLTVLVPLSATRAEAVQDLGAEQQFISLINADRRAAGLRELAPVADVRDVALAWSNVMATNRRMEHNPSYYEQFCCWRRAAENVGWTTVSDMSDPAKIAAAVERLHKAFMNSEGHRVNLMHPDHDHIGLAIELRAGSCPDGTQIRDCMWVTENFRQWNGTQPAGGLKDPYAGTSDRDGSGGATTDVTISDEVHAGGFDGNTETVERLGATVDSAIEVARARFAADAARHAILARDDTFPDALAAAPLTADGPLLFTPTSKLSSSVRDELLRTLKPGATVYLLGGEVALSKSVEDAVGAAGLKPVRIAGADRVATALEVADVVRSLYGDNRTVAIARSSGVASDPNGPSGWVDSVTGGAWAASRGVPVLVTPSDALPKNVRAWLDKDAPGSTIVLGGTSALSDAVLGAVPNGVRVAGEDRALTAAAVAKKLWGVTADSADRQFVIIDGWSADGWRHGLAAAGISSDQDAPMLLAAGAGGSQPSATTSLVAACTTPSVDLLLVGGIVDAVAGTLESVDGTAC